MLATVALCYQSGKYVFVSVVLVVVLTLRRSDRRVSMSVAMDGMSLTH